MSADPDPDRPHDFGQAERPGEGIQIKKRGRFLESTTPLRGIEAKAVAYSEAGYSHRGIAARIGSTHGTVGRYLQRAGARFGQYALDPKPDYQHDEPMVAVTEETVLGYPPGTREWWEDCASSHPDMAPDWYEPSDD